MMIGRELIQRITIFASSGIKMITQGYRNAESLYLCGLPAFVLSDGSSLALCVGRVMELSVLKR